MYKRKSTDALLQKASAQLRGEFVTKNEGDNELDVSFGSFFLYVYMYVQVTTNIDFHKSQ